MMRERGFRSELPPAVLTLWAKTGRHGDGTPTWHPLLCHLFDVAAASAALWSSASSLRWRRFMGDRLGIDEASAGLWLALWAGLHDLGKASPIFQLQPSAARCFGSTFVTRLRDTGLHVPRASVGRVAHGEITRLALRPILEDDFGLDRATAAEVATAVGGHHGILREPTPIDPDASGQAGWPEVRRELAIAVADSIGVTEVLPKPQIDIPAAMSLAGFVSVADWIGSNTEFFPHRSRARADTAEPMLEAYWKEAQRAAERALSRLGWTARPRASASASFVSLFPHLERPFPVQRAASELVDSLGDGPALVMIEAPMGEGKSEAALYVTDRRATDAGQDGCYFALPTQATSNQMFGRVRSFIERRHSGDRINLQLLHSHALLSPELEQIRRDVEEPFTPEDVHGSDGDPRDTARVIAAEWFTHRKRGLLAAFGVGTIDQALLAALRTRHVFVRLFGLSGTCVVIDEVHAYDTYMSTLLGRLLQWLASLSTSVVLLSATLPRARRIELAEAYVRGLGLDRALPALGTESYPRLTWVTDRGYGERHFDAAPRSHRRIRLEHLPPSEAGIESLGERLSRALVDGGCAAIVCNTVARAQEVFLTLRSVFPGQADDGWPELDLFHARFPFAERLERENRALVRFGKEGGTVRFADGSERPIGRPHRTVLVATQVVEQSLDLDFDLLVTELAPVDLVLQRTGRLHRHSRRRFAGLETPVVWLLDPEVQEGVPVFGASAAVYDSHALLRSWLQLGQRWELSLPDDIEPLIEATYAVGPPPDWLPPELRAAWEQTARKQAEAREADEREAWDRWLKPPWFEGSLWRISEDPREEEAPDFHAAHQALTRLTEPNVQLVLLWDSPVGPRLAPDGQAVDLESEPSGATTAALLMQALTVSDKRVVFTLRRQDPPRSWNRSPLLRHHRCLVLDAAGRAPVGSQVVELHRDLGLRVIAEEE